MSLHAHISDVSRRAKQAQAAAGTDFSPGTAGFGKTSTSPSTGGGKRVSIKAPGGNPSGKFGQGGTGTGLGTDTAKAAAISGKGSTSTDGTTGPSKSTELSGPMSKTQSAVSKAITTVAPALGPVGAIASVASSMLGAAKALGITHGVLGPSRPAVGSQAFRDVVDAGREAKAKDAAARSTNPGGPGTTGFGGADRGGPDGGRKGAGNNPDSGKGAGGGKGGKGTSKGGKDGKGGAGAKGGSGAGSQGGSSASGGSGGGSHF